MKKLEEIRNQVAAGVRKEMERCILSGVRQLHYEQAFGTAYVDVDIYAHKYPIYTVGVEVHVNHIDTQHHSPRLEKSIEAALPSWYTVRDEIMWEDSRQTA